MSRNVILATIIDQFSIFEADGYTKKSGETVFTTTLWKDGVVSAVPVTIAEIGSSGEYRVSFTPDGSGFWHLEIIIDYNKDVVGGDYEVSAEGSKAWFNASYDDATTTLYMECWLEREGALIPQADLTSVSVSVFDTAGSLTFTESSASPKADGRFALSRVVSLTADRPYNVNVTIVDNQGTVTSVHAITTVE